MYIASFGGLIEMQFHIFNHQVSWGGKESLAYPFLLWCWISTVNGALPCTISPSSPAPHKGASSRAQCSPLPMYLHTHLHKYPQWWGSNKEGWQNPCLYLFTKWWCNILVKRSGVLGLILAIQVNEEPRAGETWGLVLDSEANLSILLFHWESIPYPIAFFYLWPYPTHPWV